MSQNKGNFTRIWPFLLDFEQFDKDLEKCSWRLFIFNSEEMKCFFKQITNIKPLKMGNGQQIKNNMEQILGESIG